MTLSLPDHWSYSSLMSTYKSCPRQFYLGRLKKALPLPAWYFVVGSTVHKFIEEYLKDSKNVTYARVAELFEKYVLMARQDEPDTAKWLYGGSKDDPIVEERALELALECATAALNWLEDFTVWAVEPDISGYLPGCTKKIKAFPDLIGEHKKHGPLIVDWKTGKTRGQTMQLETYKALIEHSHEDLIECSPDDLRGQFVYLNPDATGSRPIKLAKTPADIGAMYGELERRVNKGVFPAMIQYNCKFCTMAPNCKTKSGANRRTLYYDTPEKDGVIPY